MKEIGSSYGESMKERQKGGAISGKVSQGIG